MMASHTAQVLFRLAVARNVRDLTAAEGAGRALRVEKVEKSRWHVTPTSPSKGPFTVHYKVYANELTVARMQGTWLPFDFDCECRLGGGL